MFYDVNITTYGKWILSGEHAVLRGHPALVFPLWDQKFTLNYQNNQRPLAINSEHHSIDFLFLKVFTHAHHLVHRNIAETSGTFSLTFNIPLGAGMGASAAISTAITAWLAQQQWILNEEQYHFAKKLEHLFHGESSGLDIAGVTAKSGIFFKDNQITPLKSTWEPLLFLSPSGEKGITSQCIKQVQELWQHDPKIAHQIDLNMKQSVLKARHSLEHYSSNALTHLAEAMNQANNCFHQWGLITKKLQDDMDILLNYGALAVKPTGSGYGGYILSLWAHPPEQLPLNLLPVYVKTITTSTNS